MEFTIKDFILLLCLFNFIHLENRILEPYGVTRIQGNNEAIFTIQLIENKVSFAEYIDITFSTSAYINPMIFIATDENCETNRLYIGLQKIEPIFAFIKRSKINDKFYICIKER